MWEWFLPFEGWFNGIGKISVRVRDDVLTRFRADVVGLAISKIDEMAG